MIEFLKKKCLGFPAFEIRAIITYVLHAEQLYKTKKSGSDVISFFSL